MIVAADGGSRTTDEAEHLIHELLGPAGPLAAASHGDPAPVVACTHPITAGSTGPHLAISITWRMAGPITGPTAHRGGSVAGPTSPQWVPDAVERLTAWGLQRGVGVAVSWPGASQPAVAGPSHLVRGAYVASVESALGTSGRLVLFPGRETARGVVPVRELRAKCGIDLVEPLGGLPITDDSLIDTLDFIRPIRRNGQVVLLVQPAAGGVLIPFELEHQQKCCADH